MLCAIREGDTEQMASDIARTELAAFRLPAPFAKYLELSLITLIS